MILIYFLLCLIYLPTFLCILADSKKHTKYKRNFEDILNRTKDISVSQWFITLCLCTVHLRYDVINCILFYNIVNKNTPNYLCTLIPPTIQRTSVYPLRNGNDIILPFCRLSSTSDSFIPSTIKMWNSLNNNIRNVDILSNSNQN